MFFAEQHVRVFLYGQPVDMRRSFDGLYALVRHPDQDALLRPPGSVRVGQAPGGGALRLRLEESEIPGDGLDGAEAPARRHRAESDAKAPSPSPRSRCLRYTSLMTSTIDLRAPQSLEEAARMSLQQVVDVVGSLSREVATLKHQLDWFRRQHLRLTDAGSRVSRAWLAQLTHSEVAQLASIHASRVKSMDEASKSRSQVHRAGTGPVASQPCGAALRRLRGLRPLRAQGRAHARPVLGAHTQTLLRGAGVDQCALRCRAAHPRGRARRASQARLAHAKPLVQRFFAWVDAQFERQGLLPSSPFTRAPAYARERRAGLEVYLNDLDVQIDTNHLERALRVIPMGRKNWMFSGTEVAPSRWAWCRA